MNSKEAREFLRSHVLGLVAIFIALTGTAVASQQSGASDGPKASASVVTDAKFKKLKKRVAALEAKTTPTTLPPSGPAGGDLTGTYPNPAIASGVIPTTLSPSGPAGGDLTGTYPNPAIANNAVNSSKVANGSLTSADVGKAAGTTALNFPSINAGSCSGLSVFPGVSPDGEAIVVTPSEQIDNNGFLATSAYDSNSPGAFVVLACNVTGGAIDPPGANFEWVVLDN